MRGITVVSGNEASVAGTFHSGPLHHVLTIKLRTISLAIALCASGLFPVLQAQGTPARADTTPPWRIVRSPQASIVLARDGSLIGEVGVENRISVPLSSLPKYVPQAFIAIEDQRFYQHDGVDLIGIAGAIKDAVSGNIRGASTITQQLVGNMHPNIIDRSDRSPVRKLREQAAAREMDMSYRRAWLLIDEMNRMFKEPVIAAVTGGAHGGGAQLTELGRNVIAAYRAAETDAAQILSKRLSKVLGQVSMTQPAAGRRSKRA